VVVGALAADAPAVGAEDAGSDETAMTGMGSAVDGALDVVAIVGAAMATGRADCTLLWVIA
jgi:hypothetical protein